jgi:NAD(P)H dehydrogenase (quinone)
MHKLIITAHPSTLGFTHTIATTIWELSEQKWDTVEILDLYKTELKQDFLHFEDIRTYCKDAKHDPITQAIQSKIKQADELVFIFPVWWGDMPAIMKNFFDSNFLTGFAFKYENGKSVGLLRWKTARIIATSGGPWFFYKIILHIQLLWNLNRIGFCGIKQKSFTVFWEMDSRKTDKTKYIERLKSLI